MPESKLLLAIDTCGPIGSVALGRSSGSSVKILGQTELEGRSYSSTLVAAVGGLLARTGTRFGLLHAMAAVNGPGSFTGVRVGLAAVKGFAEAAGIPVATVSRLEVLAAKAGVTAAALDAHRHELFLRLGGMEKSASGSESAGEQAREMLAGASELAVLPRPSRIAVCDEAAALLLESEWPDVGLIRTAAPTAADALRFCASRVSAGEFTELALLDGHYLRRSDAEIFGAEVLGEPSAPAPQRP